MTDTPTPAPAPMTAGKLKSLRETTQGNIRSRALRGLAPGSYATDIALLDHIDALTARVAELEQRARSAEERMRLYREQSITANGLVGKLEAELAAARKVETGEVQDALHVLFRTGNPKYEQEGFVAPSYTDIGHLLTRLSAALKEWQTLAHGAALECEQQKARAQAAEAKLYAAMDALTFILPLAKGYAHEHPVGANQRHVDEAAETLRALQTKDTTE